MLNAKQHEREATIITEAGQLSAVTIATNMAGRGTDIVLGGSWDAIVAANEDASEEKLAELKAQWQQQHNDVVALGGLCVLATERHESRRIDNQLRGRSGRQGDPGSSFFLLSMEDNLMRIFASDRVKSMMQRFGFTEEDVIENKMITNAIEKAQRRVESYNYDMRKNLLEYDDVANDQRKVVYQERNRILQEGNVSETIVALREAAVSYLVSQYADENALDEEWDISGLERQVKDDFGLTLAIQDWLEAQSENDIQAMEEFILKAIEERYQEKVSVMGDEVKQQLEKNILMQMLDQHWKGHLAAMDHLRKGIHLRTYAQKNPAQEYKKESFSMFENMLDVIGYEAVSLLSLVQLQSAEELEPVQQPAANMHYTHSEQDLFNGESGEPDDESVQPITRDGRKNRA